MIKTASKILVHGAGHGGEYKVLMIMENFNLNLENVFVPEAKKTPTRLSAAEVHERSALGHLINTYFGRETVKKNQLDK